MGKGLNGRAPDLLPEPALLVSYWYYKNFARNRQHHRFRDWVLDSGAFSAHNSGAVIDLQEYIDHCSQLLATDTKLTEVYALDIIGDGEASLRNCEEMIRQGVPAIPVFHLGSPWGLLEEMAPRYDKIALGGMVKTARKDDFIGQCFARLWPKKIHAFGVATRQMLMRWPFHSVDASTWTYNCERFGNWHVFGNMHVPRASYNLRSEVEWYLRLERELKGRWCKEMALLDAKENHDISSSAS